MNKVIIKGRLTADVKYTIGNDDLHTSYARFTVAVEDRSWKLEDGKYHVDYIPTKMIGKVAEIANTSLYKGKEVLLAGKMQSGDYVNKDGKKVYTLDLLATEIEFCGKKSEQPPSNGEFMNIPEEIDEELPFK